MLPSFLVIGAMKAGTSSLYQYLASHPELVGARHKETDFFKSARDFERGVDWYERQFRGEGRLAFEASPNYTKAETFPGVPERIRSVLPGAKFIYLVRDPIDRIVSHYVHRAAHLHESLPFEQAVEHNPNYLATSMYHAQLEHYFRCFPPDRFLVVESEQLRRDPCAALHDVFEFLGVPPDVDPAMLDRRFHESSQSMWIPSKPERRLLALSQNFYWRVAVRRVMKPFGAPVSRPEVTESTRSKLSAVLAPDVERLRDFSGHAFSSWSL